MKKGFLLLALLVYIWPVQPALGLIKRSKKDECTVCHVLWLDVFLTDQQTLLGPHRNDIVIAGSVGLSSSRRMCYSCHDGYVKDSRTVIAPDNRHHQLREVPAWLRLKDDFRLDVNNRIYCGTCHGFHDVRGMGEIGSTPFMRLDNKRSEMCTACHTDRTAAPGHENHPLQVRSDLVPGETIRKLGGRLGPEGEIICQSCHLPHGKPPLLAPLKDGRLCLLCHPDKKSILHSDHNLAVSAPHLYNERGVSPEESGPCGSCHLPHNGNGALMWARKQAAGNPISQACLSCHGREPELKVPGRYSHPLGRRKAGNAGLPLFSGKGKRDAGGSIQCATCHDVHRWNAADPDGYETNMEGGPADSFLRIANVDSALCLSCHEEKGSILGTDHDLRTTAPGRPNILGAKPADSGPCGSCHVPHNATAGKLWAGPGITGSPASAMCLACHGEDGEHIQKPVGRFSHPVGVRPAAENGAHAGLPLYTETGKRGPGGAVRCATCHNPHRWAPSSPSTGRKNNTEGGPADSFLRIANVDSALCLSCHEEKGSILDSDHNLRLTAAAAQNLPGQDVSRSGPCGACHLPHNAAGSRLWARKMSGEKDPVTRLCASCHNRHGPARGKLIGDNSHPVNVSLAGIRPDTDDFEELPLHDANENEAGKVVCTTCHDPHRWSASAVPGPETASGETGNREGDGKSSFLRRTTYPEPDLCRICHANQALITGTMHDLTRSAPEEKNIIGRTAAETGTCGACHLVHNSPNALKLWARKYGPAAENEPAMNSLCTSCHSAGNAAADRVREIAVHPQGTLTSNARGFVRVVYNETALSGTNGNGEKRPDRDTMRYTPILINNVVGMRRGGDYTPLFNDLGEEVNVGEISCPSCHDVHIWNLYDRMGIPEKPRQDRRGFRFLRTKSRDLVCVECHGPDAIYRYLYFHSPKSRAPGLDLTR